MSDIDKTLAERGERYGQFRDHAVIAQDIKDAMWHRDGWTRLAPDQKQALEVIADKVARILNGDPQYHDNWHDIVGYAKLVADRLIETQQGTALTEAEVRQLLTQTAGASSSVRYGEDRMGQRG
jgi:hypothetical protein